MSPDQAARFIKHQAYEAGFNDCRIVPVGNLCDLAGPLNRFIAANFHGSMTWLGRTAERRSHPARLWPEARSLVMVALNYGPADDPLDDLKQRDRGVISVYARHRDYHDVIKGRLKQLAGQLTARAGGDVKVFVDTAPLMEKPAAARAGIGWQGKHTNLVSRRFGSWLLLGCLMTTLELPADAGHDDNCGTCRACLDICPTGAFPAAYQLDARLCISYLTIEHKGPIDHHLRPLMGNRIYGCDDCLAVCPWNKFAVRASEVKLIARDDLNAPDLDRLSRLDEAGFRALFSGSPIKRTGRDSFVRNVLIAIGNSGCEHLTACARDRLVDSSPVVRGAAVWALSRLLAGADFRFLRQRHLPGEADPEVVREWQAQG